MTQPNTTPTSSKLLTITQLAEIEARANAATPGPWKLELDHCDCSEYGCSHPPFAVAFGPFTSFENTTDRHHADAEFAAHARTDVTAMAAEIRRLRATAETFRAEFGNVIVRGQDGNWANVADFLATGARISACGAFYPHATDTRCTKHKGHQGNHLAPWGAQTMAWPYDPRETQQPLTATELAIAQADVDHLNAEFPDEPQDGNGWPGDEHAEPGTRGWTA
ncbi:hypothetical protein [Streptomyces sp. NPDC051016]|uniref:hypothetical protein n=1 Tax=Streptomyces sp. NPDC051016 TaxID=3365638 RepID=UPI0037962450